MTTIEQQWSICNLNNDILLLMMKKQMNFKECEMVNEVFKLNMSKYDIFTTVIDNKKCRDAIELHKITCQNFYDTIVHSAFEFNTIVKLIYNVSNNTINNNNKYDFNVRFLPHFDEKTRESSIMCVKVILSIIDTYVTGEFQINNPYYYLHTSISNIIMNYLICDIQNLYQLDNFTKVTFKFRLMVFQSKWYKTSINIYKLFKMYIKQLSILQIENNFEKPEIDNEDNIDDFLNTIVDFNNLNQETIECLREFNMLLHFTALNIYIY